MKSIERICSIWFVLLFSTIILMLIIILRTLIFQQYLIESNCPINNRLDSRSSSDSMFEDQHESIQDDPLFYDRLQTALRFRTITKAPQNYSIEESRKFLNFLRKSFPKIYASELVQVQPINELSLLIKIQGSNPSLRPYMILAHYDVVPAIEEQWRYPPFDGKMVDNYIYGRGALDLKSILMAILEALEWMLTKRSEIVRSFYVAIGHDEEGRGLDGAAKIAEFMREYRLDDIEFILDEGPYIFQDSITGVRRNVAMIGIAEKGLINIRLTAKSSVGHSSLPPQKTSIVKLAEAVSRFKSTAHPNRFGQGPERETIESLAPYCSLFYKILYTNLWLFGPLVGYLLENDPLLSSLIRTSTAVTIFKGGVKDNVLPSEAEAIINHRIYPLDSIGTVLEFDRNLINDPEIQLEQLGMAVEPHPISPAGKQAFGYQTILKSIQQVFPAVAVVPGVMYAATDTRWYLNFTKNIYRFSPGYLSLENLSIVHGHNERVSKSNYLQMIEFYHHIIMNSNDLNVDFAFDDKNEL